MLKQNAIIWHLRAPAAGLEPEVQEESCLEHKQMVGSYMPAAESSV